MNFEVDDVWFGRIGTAYEGVIATIQAITDRNVQIVFDRVVAVDDMMLAGCIFGKRQFQELFDQGEQMSLDLDLENFERQ